MPDNEIVFDGIYIPYGLKGAAPARTAEEEDFGLDTLLTEDIFSDNDVLDDDEVSGEYEYDFSEEDEVDDGLLTVSAMNVISQTFRTAPDGTQVVDVVIEVSDIDGATKYEVRLNP